MMILTCPSCGTRYQADQTRFVPHGCNVRCAKCGHVWFAAPDAQAAGETEPTAGDIFASGESEPRAPASAEPARRAFALSLPLVAGWLILIGAVGAAGWAAVTYRHTVAQLWPQTATVYALIGTPVNMRGLDLTNVTYRQDTEEGQPVLSITGKVVNIANHALPVPQIHVSLSDAAKQELYHWNFDVGVTSLMPGEENPFVTRLTSPPPDTRSVSVRFAQAAGGS